MKNGMARSLRRILVVEDDGRARQFNVIVLARFGYQVDAAEDGEAGWEALCANPYDLLITDNQMPKLCGVDLVRRLRTARMGLPAILASGAFTADDLGEEPELGIVACLEKPFSAGELLGAVDELFSDGTTPGISNRESSVAPMVAPDREGIEWRSIQPNGSGGAR